MDITKLSVWLWLAVLMLAVGPVRADWGYRLTRHERTQPRSAFHVSIGHPF